MTRPCLAALLAACFAFHSAAFAAGEKTMADTDAAIAAIDAQIAKAKVDKSKSDWKQHLPKPEVVKFDPKKTYVWVLDTTKGPIELKLRPDVAPMHVTSTIYLTRLGFYDGVLFHRVIPGFMAQGGDPIGTGTGGPGYNYAGEFSPNAQHDKPGILSMANAGPNTDGSQFFITFVATQYLNGKHTVFGEVTQGTDSLKGLEAAGSESGRTREKLEIRKATIRVQ
ncbi:MAG TPA: peptidylprolyl isomerase [Myxococcota bacterium]|nr:peptidylprolyl isomerase [Myxococcota bacterium]